MSYKAMVSAAVVLVMMIVTVAVNGAPLGLDPAPTQGDSWNPNPMWTGPDRLGAEGQDNRGKILKMISSLEGLQRSINSTWRSKLTLIPRASVRGSGKKNKVAVLGEALRTTTTTTAPPVDDCGTTSKHIDNVQERHSLGGRACKKAAPQPGKKPNKRVCFWKYCTQN